MIAQHVTQPGRAAECWVKREKMSNPSGAAQFSHRTDSEVPKQQGLGCLAQRGIYQMGWPDEAFA
jgi:hypothetical protein